MKLIHKVKSILIKTSAGAALLLVTAFVLLPSPATIAAPAADSPTGGPNYSNHQCDSGVDPSVKNNAICTQCDYSNTTPGCACAPYTGTDGKQVNPCADNAASCDKDYCDLVLKYINPAINVFSIAFGLIAVASLIIGGINFSASEGDPQKASKAKNRITNTILALVAYFFLYAFLQFIIPGGAFNR